MLLGVNSRTSPLDLVSRKSQVVSDRRNYLGVDGEIQGWRGQGPLRKTRRRRRVDIAGNKNIFSELYT